jgi:acylphosphatase
MELHFRVEGKVQGVMFRQTFIRAAQKRNLKGAATNMPDGSVHCILSGPEDKINEIVEGLQSGKAINSWDASVDVLALLSADQSLAFEQHQVTTENVDSFSWSPNVEMYL